MKRYCLVATDDNKTMLIDFEKERLQRMITGGVFIRSGRYSCEYVGDLIYYGDDLNHIHHLEERFKEAVSKGFKWRYFGNQFLEYLYNLTDES